jgi:hypothetical protein
MEYKIRILKEAEAEADAAAATPGGVGALLRREGLYSSHLVSWRRERQAGIPEALKPRKRGPRSERNPLAEENRKLARQLGQLTEKLRKAELIIDVQKKSRRRFAMQGDTAKANAAYLPGCFPGAARRLEGYSSDKLNLPGRQSRGYFPECQVSHISVDRPEVRAIEKIHKVEAQLEIAPFAELGDVRVLGHTRIHLEHAGIAIAVTWQVSFR